MKNILIILYLLIFASCTNYNYFGKHRYVKITNRVNSGEFNALIFKSSLYLNDNKDTILSSLITAQKLNYESKKDTIFAYGVLNYENINNKAYFIIKEINANGYEVFNDTDSIVRYYEQINDGKIKFLKAIRYRKGIEYVFINPI